MTPVLSKSDSAGRRPEIRASGLGSPAKLPRAFPNFCTPESLFTVGVIAQIVVIVLMVSPSSLEDFTWNELGLKSLFAQWIAVTSAASLCLARKHLERMPYVWSVTTAMVTILTITAVATAGGYWLDRHLGLKAMAPGISVASHFAGTLALVGLVGAMVLRYFLLQAQWRQDLEARAVAQIQALQARIRPHFLFNSLNVIASLTRRNPETAERAIEDLADLFRAALATPNRKTVARDEIQLLRQYLSLEKLRLGDRLGVEWEIDDLPLEQPLQPLMLQPLVENAIRHGVQQISDGGTIQLRGGFDEKCWFFEVENPMPTYASPEKGGAGIALRNIRQRLEHRYGSQAGLTTTDDGLRFIARFSVPLRTHSTDT